jgi:hypothetical protein
MPSLNQVSFFKKP